MKKRYSALALILPLGGQSLAVAGETYQYGGLEVTPSLTAGAAAIQERGAMFGAGRPGTGATRLDWQEFYLKPGLNLGYQVNEDLRWVAGISAVGAATRGDGDPAGFTRSGDQRVHLEESFVGAQLGDWRLTVGRQNYLVGSGFIVQDGRADLGRDGAYWLAPRTAFDRAGVLSWSHGSWKAQGFTLGAADSLGGDYRLSGGNLDYDSGYGVLGALAFGVSADTQNAVKRDGMRVYNLRWLNATLPGIPELALSGEYAWQRGSGNGLTYAGDAWYAQAQYQFKDLPLQPQLSYRYAHFSGDPDPSDTRLAGWDPLTKGYTDWGTWLIGDVVGNYLLFNNNENVHSLHLKTRLNESWAVGTLFHAFSLDQKNFQGQPVSDRRFADETTLYVEWTPTPSIYAAVAYNWVQAKQAAREVLGDERFNALEAYVTYKF
ncbi:alginate export family protein [uncultured Pseudomonas sp.]|uniref:alginate export family protein n=1 Tax=uncultured Pseudomonas sp. TaxID=114707 RepID=UPI0025F3FAE7|nr:alginate export family protein [uncultured Pseudomonas sp.]